MCSCTPPQTHNFLSSVTHVTVCESLSSAQKERHTQGDCWLPHKKYGSVKGKPGSTEQPRGPCSLPSHSLSSPHGTYWILSRLRDLVDDAVISPVLFLLM